MPSKSRKERLRAMRDANERAAAIARPRHLLADISYPGVGALLAQLVRAPSFERTCSWEIRSRDDELVLLRSMSPEPDQFLLVGHDQYRVSKQILRRLIDSLRQISVPVFPAVAPFGVADGCRMELVFGVGFMSRSHFSWSEGYAPNEWASVVRMAEQNVRAAAPRSAQPGYALSECR
jgi:hypothetical protein